MSDRDDPEHEIRWLDQARIGEGFFTVDKITLQHSLFSGAMTPPLIRYLLRRPDAVCAIVVNLEEQLLYFVRQFRVGPASKGDPAWMIELVAGIVDEDETPHTAMLREIREELGFEVTVAEEVMMIYPSSAIISERIYVYYVQVTNTQRVAPGGGNPLEHEDLEILEVPVDRIKDFIAREQITDAKTIVGLNWFQSQKARPGKRKA